jgi:ATP-dependent RNA helicase DeaD
MKNIPAFEALGLSKPILDAIAAKGFEEPSPIQAATIPMLLADTRDLIGQAQTGTGKTAAFGIPILEKIQEKANHVQALILVPTRELAMQVSEEISSLKGTKRLIVTPIYGGASIEQQSYKLSRGVDIVVGTPGRVLDHIRNKRLKLENIKYLVLDEADEMLNMGFIDDMEQILETCNSERRTLLFSATMPAEIVRISRKYMVDPESISIKGETQTTSLTDQIYFEVRQEDKFEALCRIIDIEKEFYGLIFCRTKLETDEVASRMIDRSYDTDCLHGDISQSNRERILAKFKKKKINILVATDVAARGIDISNLTHVINYSLPQDPESYVHRIGRTGRAGHQGTAITFVTPREMRSLFMIQRVSKAPIRKEKIPNVKDIIERKKGWVFEEIQQLVEKGISADFKKMALELIATGEPTDLVSALLELAYKEELDASSYANIRDIESRSDNRGGDNRFSSDRGGDRHSSSDRFSSDRGGRRGERSDYRESRPERNGATRLFIGMGKKEGMTKRTIVDLIKEKANTHDRKIDNVEVFENYSFISVPFEEAEIILRRFQSEKVGHKQLIERAGAKEDGSGGDRQQSDRPSSDRGGEGRGYSSGGRSGGYNSDRGRSGGGGGRDGERRGGSGEGRSRRPRN